MADSTKIKNNFPFYFYKLSPEDACSKYFMTMKTKPMCSSSVHRSF